MVVMMSVREEMVVIMLVRGKNGDDIGDGEKL